VGQRIDIEPDDVTPPFDELGSAPLPMTGARLLFAVFSQRYERGSTIVTSRRRTQLERLSQPQGVDRRQRRQGHQRRHRRTAMMVTSAPRSRYATAGSSPGWLAAAVSATGRTRRIVEKMIASRRLAPRSRASARSGQPE
jgi:hypothetical protein